MKNSIHRMKLFETLVGACTLGSVVVLLYLLVVSVSSAQVRLMRQRDQQVQIRIAYNYILSRLHQFDISDVLQLEENPVNPSSTALVIQSRGGEGNFDTWIYSYSDTLYECLTEPDCVPNHELAFVIATSANLSVRIDATAVRWCVFSPLEEEGDLSGLFTLRTGGVLNGD